MRTGWLTFHDRKWLTLKRPLTITDDVSKLKKPDIKEYYLEECMNSKII